MKNLIRNLSVSFIVTGCLLSTSIGFAADNINVLVDGKQVVFDVHPIILQDRTLIPIRAVSEVLGTEVSWDETTKTVTITGDDKKIILTVDKADALVDGAKKVMDVPPSIISDRTFVPLRFLSESFGISVRWNENTNTVTLDSTIQFGKLPITHNTSHWEYEGEYAGGLPNGYGRITDEHQSIVCEGEWANGQLTGYGKVHMGSDNILYYKTTGEEVNISIKDGSSSTRGGSSTSKQVLYKEIVSKYTDQLSTLESETMETLDGLVQQAMEEYHSLPEDKKESSKLALGLKYLTLSNSFERECDTKFNRIIADMEQELDKNGISSSDAVNDAKTKYRAKKEEYRKAILSKVANAMK